MPQRSGACDGGLHGVKPAHVVAMRIRSKARATKMPSLMPAFDTQDAVPGRTALLAGLRSSAAIRKKALGPTRSPGRRARACRRLTSLIFCSAARVAA